MGTPQVRIWGLIKKNDNKVIQLLEDLENNIGSASRQFYSNLAWIGYPILSSNQDLLATDVSIKIRVSKEYKNQAITNSNDSRPHYGWDMDANSTKSDRKDALAEALKLINIVPNPYYAYSEYEQGRLDTRVKLTNLPEVCNVAMYTTSGKLVRKFKKDAPETYLNWDLKNSQGIPVSSGIYLIHIEVPGIGEVIVKFFCAMREIDLENI